MTNKIDDGVNKPANKIDRGVEEITGSKYVRLLTKLVVTCAVSGFGGTAFAVIGYLSTPLRYEDIFTLGGFVVGVILAKITWSSLNK